MINTNDNTTEARIRAIDMIIQAETVSTLLGATPDFELMLVTVRMAGEQMLKAIEKLEAEAAEAQAPEVEKAVEVTKPKPAKRKPAKRKPLKP
jgi:SPX domain protein involved in polyphosphate accumulation